MQPLLLAFSALFLACSVFRVDAALENIMAAISKVTPESLSETFNFKGGVDVSNTLASILVSLEQDEEENESYFFMLETFLEEFERQNIAPEFAEAWATLCSIIRTDRANQVRGRDVSLEETITKCFKKSYGQNLNPKLTELSNTFHALAPYMNRAKDGRVGAARKLIRDLAKHCTDFKQLTALDRNSKMEFLRKLHEKLQGLANGGFQKVIKVTEKEFYKKYD